MVATACPACGEADAVQWVADAALDVCIHCGTVLSDGTELYGVLGAYDELLEVHEPWASDAAFRLRRHDRAAHRAEKERAQQVGATQWR